MDPVTLAAVAGVVLVALLVGLGLAWWTLRTAVRWAKRLVVLGLLLALGTGLAVAALVGLSLAR